MILGSAEGGAVLQPSSELGGGGGLYRAVQKYTKRRDNNTYESSKSAVLQSRDNPHAINSVLQLCVTLSFTVRVAQLCDQNIEKNHYNHRHVGEENQDCQPANRKQKKTKKEKHSLHCKNTKNYTQAFLVQIERKASGKKKQIYSLLSPTNILHFPTKVSIAEILIHPIKSVEFSCFVLFCFLQVLSIRAQSAERAGDPVIFDFFQRHPPEVVISCKFFLD